MSDKIEKLHFGTKPPPGHTIFDSLREDVDKLRGELRSAGRGRKGQKIRYAPTRTPSDETERSAPPSTQRPTTTTTTTVQPTATQGPKRTILGDIAEKIKTGRQAYEQGRADYDRLKSEIQTTRDKLSGKYDTKVRQAPDFGSELPKYISHPKKKHIVETATLSPIARKYLTNAGDMTAEDRKAAQRELDAKSSPEGAGKPIGGTAIGRTPTISPSQPTSSEEDLAQQSEQASLNKITSDVARQLPSVGKTVAPISRLHTDPDPVATQWRSQMPIAQKSLNGGTSMELLEKLNSFIKKAEVISGGVPAPPTTSIMSSIEKAKGKQTEDEDINKLNDRQLASMVLSGNLEAKVIPEDRHAKVLAALEAGDYVKGTEMPKIEQQIEMLRTSGKGATKPPTASPPATKTPKEPVVKPPEKKTPVISPSASAPVVKPSAPLVEEDKGKGKSKVAPEATVTKVAPTTISPPKREETPVAGTSGKKTVGRPKDSATKTPTVQQPIVKKPENKPTIPVETPPASAVGEPTFDKKKFWENWKSEQQKRKEEGKSSAFTPEPTVPQERLTTPEAEVVKPSTQWGKDPMRLVEEDPRTVAARERTKGKVFTAPEFGTAQERLLATPEGSTGTALPEEPTSPPKVFGSREFQEGMKRLREQEEKLRHTPPETTYEEVGLKSMTKSLSDKIINEIKSDIFKEIEKQLKKCKKS